MRLRHSLAADQEARGQRGGSVVIVASPVREPLPGSCVRADLCSSKPVLGGTHDSRCAMELGPIAMSALAVLGQLALSASKLAPLAAACACLCLCSLCEHI